MDFIKTIFISDKEKSHKSVTTIFFTGRKKNQTSSPLEQSSSQKETIKAQMQKCWQIYQDNDTLSLGGIFKLVDMSQNDLERVVTQLSPREAIFLKRTTQEFWVNNCNADLLRTWNANRDIQFILNPYSCIMYVVSYISKAEREDGPTTKACTTRSS